MLPNVHVISLEETPERTARVSQHLALSGVRFQLFEGINADVWGLATRIPYEVDHPGTGYIIPPKHVGLHLSHYWLWRQFEKSSESEMTVLEDDAAFAFDGWSDAYSEARRNLPENWDMLFIGSGNAENKPRDPVGGNVFNVKWPQCTHAYIVHRKALPVLLRTQRRSWAPIDLALIFNSFPHLNVYTVLPRLMYQTGQEYIAP